MNKIDNKYIFPAVFSFSSHLPHRTLTEESLQKNLYVLLKTSRNAKELT